MLSTLMRQMGKREEDEEEIWIQVAVSSSFLPNRELYTRNLPQVLTIHCHRSDEWLEIQNFGFPSCIPKLVSLFSSVFYAKQDVYERTRSRIGKALARGRGSM